jgi:hypothetical protein
MQQSPSLEANRYAGSQEIPHILWNPKVHYHIHKCSPPVSILRLLNPIHSSTFHFLKIHFNIIRPCKPVSPHWSLSLRFPHLNPVHASALPHPCYVSSLSLSYRFYHPHNIGWAVQIITNGTIFVHRTPLIWRLREPDQGSTVDLFLLGRWRKLFAMGRQDSSVTVMNRPGLTNLLYTAFTALPFFIYIARPACLYCVCVCVCVCKHTYIWLRSDDLWITVVIK